VGVIQDGLFPEPAHPPRPAPRLATSAAVPRYTRYKPVLRVLCDDCVRLIHQLGVAAAPLPLRGRWRRVAGDAPPDVLCDEHKRLRQAEEKPGDQK
jgi:hypothetical protein